MNWDWNSSIHEEARTYWWLWFVTGRVSRVKFFLQWSSSVFSCKWDGESKIEGMTPGFNLTFGALLSKSVFIKCLEHNTSPFLGSQMLAVFTSSLFIANTHFLLMFSSVGNTWNVSPFNLEFGKQREAHPMAEQHFTMILGTHNRTLAATAALTSTAEIASPSTSAPSPWEPEIRTTWSTAILALGEAAAGKGCGGATQLLWAWFSSLGEGSAKCEGRWRRWRPRPWNMAPAARSEGAEAASTMTEDVY